MPPDNPEVVKASLIFSRDSRTFVNTLHITKSGGWTVPNMTDLAIELEDWWNDNYRAASSNTVALREIQVRLYDPDNPLAVDYPVSPPIPGLQSTAPAPGNASQTISWRTGLAGRKHRGRIYTVGLIEADANNDDSVLSTRTLQLASAGTNLLVRLSVMAVQLVVFHKVDNTVTNVLTAVVENLIDSMRNRLASRGT